MTTACAIDITAYGNYQTQIMPKASGSSRTRKPRHLFDLEKDAATPWPVRRCKAARYAGFAWMVSLFGMCVAKYGLKVLDQSLATLLLKITLIAAMFFTFVIFAYWQNDIEYRQSRRRGEKNNVV
jgi:hypothetical protein